MIEEGIETYKTDWVVYIIRCSDDSYYTGISNNIEARVKKHNAGKGAKYTRSRRPVELIWSEPARNRSEASKRECEIKKMKRIDKIALISVSSV